MGLIGGRQATGSYIPSAGLIPQDTSKLQRHSGPLVTPKYRSAGEELRAAMLQNLSASVRLSGQGGGIYNASYYDSEYERIKSIPIEELERRAAEAATLRYLYDELGNASYALEGVALERSSLFNTLIRTDDIDADSWQGEPTEREAHWLRSAVASIMLRFYPRMGGSNARSDVLPVSPDFWQKLIGQTHKGHGGAQSVLNDLADEMRAAALADVDRVFSGAQLQDRSEVRKGIESRTSADWKKLAEGLLGGKSIFDGGRRNGERIDAGRGTIQSVDSELKRRGLIAGYVVKSTGTSNSALAAIRKALGDGAKDKGILQAIRDVSWSATKIPDPPIDRPRTTPTPPLLPRPAAAPAPLRPALPGASLPPAAITGTLTPTTRTPASSPPAPPAPSVLLRLPPVGRTSTPLPRILGARSSAPPPPASARKGNSAVLREIAQPRAGAPLKARMPGGTLGGGFGTLGLGGGTLGMGFGTLGAGFGLLGRGGGLTGGRRVVDVFATWVPQIDPDAKVTKVKLRPAGYRQREREKKRAIPAPVAPSPPAAPLSQQKGTFLRLDQSTGRPVVLADGKELLTTWSIGSTAMAPGQSVLVTTINGQNVMETPEQAKRRMQKPQAARDPGPTVPEALASISIPWMTSPLEFYVRSHLGPISTPEAWIEVSTGDEAHTHRINLQLWPTPYKPGLTSRRGELVTSNIPEQPTSPAVGDSYSGTRTYEANGCDFARDSIRYVVTKESPSSAIVTFGYRCAMDEIYILHNQNIDFMFINTLEPDTYANPACCHPSVPNCMDGAAPWYVPAWTYDGTFTLIDLFRRRTEPFTSVASIRVTRTSVSGVATPPAADSAIRASLSQIEFRPEVTNYPEGPSSGFSWFGTWPRTMVGEYGVGDVVYTYSSLTYPCSASGVQSTYDEVVTTPQGWPPLPPIMTPGSPLPDSPVEPVDSGALGVKLRLI